VGNARDAEESKGDIRRVDVVGQRERRPHHQQVTSPSSSNARGGSGNARGAEERKGDGRRVDVVGQRERRPHRQRPCESVQIISPYTLYPIPHTLHLTLYALRPTPYTLQPLSWY